MASARKILLFLALQTVCVHCLPTSAGHLARSRSWGNSQRRQRAQPPCSLRLRGGKSTPRNPFSLEPLSVGRQNLVGFLFVLVFIPLEVEIIGFIGRQKLLPAAFVRKLTHIFTGSTMFACVSLLPLGESWSGRFAIACFMNLFIAAFAFGAYIPEDRFKKLPAAIKDRIQSLVNSCSRSGKRRELALGTLFYCIPSSMLLVLFGTAPITVFALSALFIGDGLADPIGRTFGSDKSMQYDLPWYNNTKSYPGSMAFLLGSFGASLLYGSLFKWAGHYTGIGYSNSLFLQAAGWSALVSTLVEAVCPLSPPDLDNLLVPLASIMTTTFLSESGRIPFLLSTSG